MGPVGSTRVGSPKDAVDTNEPLIMFKLPDRSDLFTKEPDTNVPSKDVPPSASEAEVKWPPSIFKAPNEPVEVDAEYEKVRAAILTSIEQRRY